MARKKASAGASDRGTGSDELPFLWKIAQFIIDHLEELGAVLLTGLGILLFLGLAGWTSGSLIDPLSKALSRWFGWSAYLFPLTMILGAFIIIRSTIQEPLEISWKRVLSFELTILAFLGLQASVTGLSLIAAEEGANGGLVGWGIATLLEDFLGIYGAGIVLILLVVIFGYYTFNPFLKSLLRRQPIGRFATPVSRDSDAEIKAEIEGTSEPSDTEVKRAGRTRPVPPEHRKNFYVPEQIDEPPAKPVSRSNSLPPIRLLQEGNINRVSAREINRSAGVLEATLDDFGLPAKVVDFKVGPTVTQFAVEPGYVEQITSEGEIRKQKVRVAQISALSKDLALALSAPRVRIQAPVPGEKFVGVEIPNRNSAFVRLRPILESNAFQELDSPLSIALGRDVSGEPVAADLATMPHMLISGTTGSGKSVFITSIATCLLMNNSPEQLRIVMIDPKRVELIRFNEIPHLFGNVESDLNRISGVLRWCTMEMDERYRKFERAQARDLISYNRKIRRRTDGIELPRLVIMIDELADLMMLAPDQTEQTLVRLAQMGRATGIHLVVATQRPSTDVVTGLIKANFPARVSFAVASSTDSRVILDSPGAETLMGQGDMLYLAQEASVPFRVQGVYISDPEIDAVVGFWKDDVVESVEETDETAPWEPVLEKQVSFDDEDEIIEKAILLVRQEGRASASMLQRKLRIGYPRAARLMDDLEELGIIGRPQSGGKTREVLLPDEE